MSQEELAERIYVSRQTISNWETDKTYPDIQSLLLLSTLFDVTLDDLVKGDVETMKKTVDAKKMVAWYWVLTISILVGLLLIIPCMQNLGNIGIVIPLAVMVVGVIASFIIERIKKDNNVQTFAEILSFIQGKELNEERAVRERKHIKRERALALTVALIIGALLAVAAQFLFGPYILA
jgi:DNA-binding XRE family transcriptional regulator